MYLRPSKDCFIERCHDPMSNHDLKYPWMIGPNAHDRPTAQELLLFLQSIDYGVYIKGDHPPLPQTQGFQINRFTSLRSLLPDPNGQVDVKFVDLSERDPQA